MTKNAVTELSNELGVVHITDNKGTWAIHSVYRRCRPGGWYLIQRIDFNPNMKRLPKAPENGIENVLEMNHDISPEHLKSMIKNHIGYVPTEKTVYEIHRLLQQYADAYLKEDEYYKEQPTDEAQAKLDQMMLEAEARLQAMEMDTREQVLSQSIFLIRNEVFSSKEYCLMTECAKVISNSTTLADDWETEFIYKPLRAVCDRQSDQLKKEKDEWKYRRVLSLLDHDIEIRRVAAATRVSISDLRFESLIVEVVHRLYGYTTNSEDYFKNYEYLQWIFEKHGMRCTTDFDLFVNAVKEYEKDGMLPSNYGLHERLGTYAYGDTVYYTGTELTHQGRNFKVGKVFKKGIFVTEGFKFTNSEVTHYIYSHIVDNPGCVSMWLNTLKDEINNKKRGQGSNTKDLDGFAEGICLKIGTGMIMDSMIRRYDKEIEEEERPSRRAALQLLRDAFRCQQLLKMLEKIKGDTSDITLSARVGMQLEIDELRAARADLYTVTD